MKEDMRKLKYWSEMAEQNRLIVLPFIPGTTVKKGGEDVVITYDLAVMVRCDGGFEWVPINDLDEYFDKTDNEELDDLGELDFLGIFNLEYVD